MSNPRNATTSNRGRTYRWREENFTSVTTIIGGGIPKPALKTWGERLVAETAFDKLRQWSKMSRDEAVDWLKRSPFRETTRASVQGSDLHAWSEAFTLGEPVVAEDLPYEQQPYARGFLQFWTEMHPQYEMAEASVYNREHGYAGTLDALMTVPRAGPGLGLVDYKTGKGVYGEVALQLSAYRNAEFIGLRDGTEIPMPTVDWCAVLHLQPDGYELIPVDAGAIAFEYFLAAQIVRDFCDDYSKLVLLSPITIPADPPRQQFRPNVPALVD